MPIAFLRGLNVGGHTVKMDALRELFSWMGFRDVSTFIASGNVIFEADDAPPVEVLEARIEAELEAALGYAVATFIRLRAEVARIAARAGGGARAALFDAGALATKGARVHVGFLKTAPGARAQALLDGYRTPEDDFRVHDREVYWLRLGRMSDSSFTTAAFERALGVPSTWRNANTVRRLAERYGGP